MNDKIGMIVDGPGDFGALKTRFRDGCRILKTDGPRSHTVPPALVVGYARKQIAMLRACRCSKIVLVVDFEERSMAYSEFLRRATEAIMRQGFDALVALASPNRMIENWYLADIEHLSKRKKFLKKNLKQKNYEGQHGKKELRKCFTKGHTYSETTHGPQMFGIIRFGVARSNSASLDHFLRLVSR